MVIQVCAKKFHPVIYWTTIVATTTVGTTLADFADRSLGVGYAGGTTILFVLLISSLFIWHRTLGSVAVDTVSSPKSEVFYWITIMFSQTLGTALGDWMADDAGLGYGGSAWCSADAGRDCGDILPDEGFSALFYFGWHLFITRPLGAVVGDFLDKPLSKGGLELSRYSASTVLVMMILFCIFFFPHKPAKRAH